MLFRLHSIDDAGNLSFWADYERRPVNAHIFLAVKALFFKDVELLGDRFVHVGQQRVGKVVFLFEFFLRRRGVGGDAEDHRAGALNLLECVAEPARLYRSTRRVGLREEEQDHVLAAIILEGDRLALFVGQGELGGFIINLHSQLVLILQ